MASCTVRPSMIKRAWLKCVKFKINWKALMAARLKNKDTTRLVYSSFRNWTVQISFPSKAYLLPPSQFSLLSLEFLLFLLQILNLKQITMRKININYFTMKKKREKHWFMYSSTLKFRPPDDVSIGISIVASWP